MPATSMLSRRDVDDDGSFWYYSDEAASMKYGVLFSILFIAFLVILAMWVHARQRLKAGLPPLQYHRVCARSLPTTQPATNMHNSG